MAEHPRELDRIQRWFQAVIAHPYGVEAGLRSPEAREQIDVETDDVERVVSRSRNLSSLRRIDIYHNAYYARLVDILCEEFPALKHAVGDEEMKGLAFGYLQFYPSTSYTLANLSRDLPQYLDETRPAADRDQEVSNFSDFLVDVAAVERTYSEVFDLPGPEGGRHLQPADLEAVDPRRWGAARLVPVECLRLRAYRFPVHEYVTDVRNGGDPQPPLPAPTYLAICRREYIVRRQPVNRVQFELLSAIVAGLPLGAAIERAIDATGADPDALLPELGPWFSDWTAAQFFLAVEFEE